MVVLSPVTFWACRLMRLSAGSFPEPELVVDEEAGLRVAAGLTVFREPVESSRPGLASASKGCVPRMIARLTTAP
jgi:hypothetical protein